MRAVRLVIGAIALAVLAGCSSAPEAPSSLQARSTATAPYIIGPGDQLSVFVWRNPDLSTSVPVRPDGRISVPLIEDLDAIGKTPSELRGDIEKRLAKYVQDPLVTVIVTGFRGPFEEQIRIIGEASDPKMIPYQANMTVLDAMIEVGGLTRFAAGNRAVLLRRDGTQQRTLNVRLDDLIRDGDVSANVPMAPGDILIIPQSWF